MFQRVYSDNKSHPLQSTNRSNEGNLWINSLGLLILLYAWQVQEPKEIRQRKLFECNLNGEPVKIGYCSELMDLDFNNLVGTGGGIAKCFTLRFYIDA